MYTDRFKLRYADSPDVAGVARVFVNRYKPPVVDASFLARSQRGVLFISFWNATTSRKWFWYEARNGDGTYELKVLYGKESKMADKKVGKWNGFYNHALTKDEKKAVKELAGDLPALWAMVERAVDEYHKVSVTWDTKRDTAMCSLSCYDETAPQYKYTMVMRAKTATGALAAAMYVHDVVLQGKWDVVDEDVDVDF